MSEDKDSASSKIRKIMKELGPLGMLAVIAATVIALNLLREDVSGGLFGSGSPPAISEVETRDQQKITALFNAIDGVTVDEIIISYNEVVDSSSTLFASSQVSQVSSGVVVLYQGTITAEYDVTQAISLLLDVPFHQITLMNITNLGGN